EEGDRGELDRESPLGHGDRVLAALEWLGLHGREPPRREEFGDAEQRAGDELREGERHEERGVRHWSCPPVARTRVARNAVKSARGVGTEVGPALVRRARIVVGPGAPRAPRTAATGDTPESAPSRLRPRGLHAAAISPGRWLWTSFIPRVRVSMCTSRRSSPVSAPARAKPSPTTCAPSARAHQSCWRSATG